MIEIVRAVDRMSAATSQNDDLVRETGYIPEELWGLPTVRQYRTFHYQAEVDTEVVDNPLTAEHAQMNGLWVKVNPMAVQCNELPYVHGYGEYPPSWWCDKPLVQDWKPLHPVFRDPNSDMFINGERHQFTNRSPVVRYEPIKPRLRPRRT